MLRNPCILRGPQREAQGEIQKVTSPLPSRGPTRGRKCYVTPAFLRVPSTEKSSTGYLTIALSRAQKRAELLRNPCIARCPQSQVLGENQKGLPHPRLLGGPKEGGSAT